MKNLAFDVESMRRLDANGYLHVKRSNLTCVQIAPYLGQEIPDWEALGLEPDKVYRMYRPAEEIARAVPTFNGLPVLLQHEEDSAENPQTDLRVGSTGTAADFDGEYLHNALVIQDQRGIEVIEDGSQKEISPGYRYDPAMTPGVWQGQEYDGVITNIQGNHIALVAKGRSGPGVVVADSAEHINPNSHKDGLMKKAAKAIMAKLKGKGLALDDGAPLEKVEEVLTEALEEVKTEIQAENGGEPPALDGEGETPAAGPDKDAPAQDNGLETLKKLLAPLLADRTDVDGTPIDQWLEQVAAALDPAAPAADNAPEGEQPAAKDNELAKDSAARVKLALDAAAMESRLAARFRAKEEAAQAIRPLVGEVSALAFDSAEAVYAYALEKNGLNPKDYPAAAYAGMVKVLTNSRLKQAQAGAALGMDADPDDGGLGLDRFTVLN